MSSRELLQCLADSLFLDLQDTWNHRQLTQLHLSIFDKRRIQADLREGSLDGEEEDDEEEQYSPPHREPSPVPSAHTAPADGEEDDDDDGSSVLSFGCG